MKSSREVDWGGRFCALAAIGITSAAAILGSAVPAAATPGIISVTPPTISSMTPRVGQTLSVTPNESNPAGWSPSGLAFSYQWYKCSATTASCTAVDTRQTSMRHTVTAAENGFRLKVQVRATKAGYTTAYSSSQSTASVTKSDLQVRISSPVDGSSVGPRITASGTSRNLPKSQYVWVMVRAVTTGLYWPQAEAILDRTTGRWSVPLVYIGDPARNQGEKFEVKAVTVDSAGRQLLQDWRNSLPVAGGALPSTVAVRSTVTVVRV